MVIKIVLYFIFSLFVFNGEAKYVYSYGGTSCLHYDDTTGDYLGIVSGSNCLNSVFYIWSIDTLGVGYHCRAFIRKDSTRLTDEFKGNVHYEYCDRGAYYWFNNVCMRESQLTAPFQVNARYCEWYFKSIDNQQSEAHSRSNIAQ